MYYICRPYGQILQIWLAILGTFDFSKSRPIQRFNIPSYLRKLRPVCADIAQEEMKEVISLFGIAPARDIHVKKLCNLTINNLCL